MNLSAGQINQTESWIYREIKKWSNKINKKKYDIFIDQIAVDDPRVYKYIINDHNVEIYGKQHMSDLAEKRSLLYLDYLKHILSLYNFKGAINIAICIGDTPPAKRYEFPIFAFDKLDDEEKILIPDCDYITSDYYRSPLFVDSTLYKFKRNKAFFAGATTGGHCTMNNLINKRVPRVRSAEYFVDSELVDFKITTICQTNCKEEEDYIKNLGVFSQRQSWDSQTKNKFLISMDGNGATWSRMIKILYSNSVLLKYVSPRIQFYYNSLIPSVHYITIQDDKDVIQVVQDEVFEPGKYQHVADASADFARKHLCKNSIDYFVVNLLREFSKLVF
jgi:hypothetical protein